MPTTKLTVHLISTSCRPSQAWPGVIVFALSDSEIRPTFQGLCPGWVTFFTFSLFCGALVGTHFLCDVMGWGLNLYRKDNSPFYCLPGQEFIPQTSCQSGLPVSDITWLERLDPLRWGTKITRDRWFWSKLRFRQWMGTVLERGNAPPLTVQQAKEPAQQTESQETKRNSPYLCLFKYHPQVSERGTYAEHIWKHYKACIKYNISQFYMPGRMRSVCLKNIIICISWLLITSGVHLKFSTCPQHLLAHPIFNWRPMVSIKGSGRASDKPVNNYVRLLH